MCQYSSLNGSPSSWHYQHLGKLALSGAGMLMLESTAINRTGKITHNDLCLFNNTQEKKLKKLFQFIKICLILLLGFKFLTLGEKDLLTYLGKKNSPLNKRERRWITVAPSSIKRSWMANSKRIKSKEYKRIKKRF